MRLGQSDSGESKDDDSEQWNPNGPAPALVLENNTTDDWSANVSYAIDQELELETYPPEIPRRMDPVKTASGNERRVAVHMSEACP